MLTMDIDRERDISLVVFTEAHIRPVLQLMNQEGWYYYDDRELRRYLKLHQDCFTLLHGDKVIGSIFTTNYTNQAWLGNIIVSAKTEAKPATAEPTRFLYRNRGYGSMMIKHAMRVLGAKGIRTFRLGSVPTAIGVYRKAGFRAEAFTTAQEASLPIDTEMEIADTGESSLSIVEMTADDLAGDVARIDGACFKSNRHDLFKELYRDSIRESCLCLKNGNTTVGYIMIRRRSVTREEGGFAEGPDLVYRLGPSCVLPEYGLEGFKMLFHQAIRPINGEVERSGLAAKMYVVFPQNGTRERIYQDFKAMGGESPERVFTEHDHIFAGNHSTKNDALWSWMKSIGFHQEYFEQSMCVTPGEAPNWAAQRAAAQPTMADGEGIFASATPGDKA
jgi:GNAT superfamily N-acetyltransferase